MNFMSDAMPESFWKRCIPEPNSGCWLWIGARTGANYGQFSHMGTRVYAHRLALTVATGVGPSKGAVTDHLCRNTLCVNPAHLEFVTDKENVLRGVGWTAVQARKTHCVNGHPFDELNTYQRKTRPGRECRACFKARRSNDGE